jgi:hypothetical protein
MEVSLAPPPPPHLQHIYLKLLVKLIVNHLVVNKKNLYLENRKTIFSIKYFCQFLIYFLRRKLQATSCKAGLPLLNVNQRLNTSGHRGCLLAGPIERAIFFRDNVIGSRQQ